MLSDAKLFEKKDYEGILKKYDPLIKKASFKQFKINRDKSEEFEDIYQINKLTIFNYILYIEKKIQKKEIDFNHGSTLGIFFKQRLTTYSNAKSNKKRNKVHQNLSYFSEQHQFSDFSSNDCFCSQSIEFDCYYDNFLKTLSKEERKFMEVSNKYNKKGDVARVLNISCGKARKIREIVKQKYIDYFFKGEKYENRNNC